MDQARESKGEAVAEVTQRPHPALLLAVALLATVVVYVPSLQGPFLWDDRLLILGSKAITGPSPLAQLFTTPFWLPDELTVNPTAYYRPLTTASYVVDHAVHNQNPMGFHLTNLVLHVATTALLFTLLRRRGCSGPGAAMVSTAWALIPRLAECVAWISGRTDVLATFFCLLALVVWRPTLTGRVLAALSLLGGLLCKEVAIAGLFALLVLELQQGKTPWKRRLFELLPLGVALLGYVILRQRALWGVAPMGSLEQGARRFTLIVEAIGRYAQMILLPWLPQAQIGDRSRGDTVFIILGVLVLLGLMVLLSRPRLRTALGAQMLGLTLLVVSLGLVLHILPLPIPYVAADRFLYLPLAGLALCLPVPWLRSRFALVSLLLFVVTLIWPTWARASLWADPMAFWTDALKAQDPPSAMACNQLALLESDAGNHERAEQLYRRELQQTPDSHRVLQNLAITRAKLGDYPGAYQLAERATAARPDIPKGWYDQATMAIRLGRFDVADVLLRRALALKPDYADAKRLISRLPAMQKDAKLLEKPDLKPAERAKLLGMVGRFKEAEQAWLQALGTDRTASLRVTAGAAVLNIGSAQGAQRAIELLECRQASVPEIQALCEALSNRISNSRRLMQLRPGS